MAAIALVLVSLGNIYRIFAKGTQIKVWVPKQRAEKPAAAAKSVRVQARPINVEAVEVLRRPEPPKLEGPQEWTFDDMYGARRG